MAAAAPAIITQPVGQNVAPGGVATFSVTATGTPAPIFQWQTSTDYGATWTDLPDAAPYGGVATPTLTIAGVSASLNGTRYRVVASNPSGSAASNPVLLFTSLVYFLNDARIRLGSLGTVEVDVVNPATNDIVARIPLAAPPPSLNRAIRPDGSVGYVADGPSVLVLDLRANRVIRRGEGSGIDAVHVWAYPAWGAIRSFWAQPMSADRARMSRRPTAPSSPNRRAA